MAKPLLKLRMAGAGITSQELASYLGISHCTMSYKLNGLREWTVSEMWRVSDFLGLELTEIPVYFPPKDKERKR